MTAKTLAHHHLQLRDVSEHRADQTGVSTEIGLRRLRTLTEAAFQFALTFT